MLKVGKATSSKMDLFFKLTIRKPKQLLYVALVILFYLIKTLSKFKTLLLCLIFNFENSFAGRVFQRYVKFCRFFKLVKSSISQNIPRWLLLRDAKLCHLGKVLRVSLFLDKNVGQHYVPY